MSVYYIDRWTTRGKCRFCGKQGPEKVINTKRPAREKYFKAQYGWMFKKVSVFRGDDEFLGKVCAACKKSGKFKEFVNTQPKG